MYTAHAQAQKKNDITLFPSGTGVPSTVWLDGPLGQRRPDAGVLYDGTDTAYFRRRRFHVFLWRRSDVLRYTLVEPGSGPFPQLKKMQNDTNCRTASAHNKQLPQLHYRCAINSQQPYRPVTAIATFLSRSVLRRMIAFHSLHSSQCAARSTAHWSVYVDIRLTDNKEKCAMQRHIKPHIRQPSLG